MSGEKQLGSSEEIYKAVLSLASRKAMIEPALRSCKRYSNDEDVKWTLCNYILIQVKSFLDEWHKFASLRGQSEAIKQTVEVADPAIARIKRWKGISSFRSKVLAHARNGQTNSFEVPSEYAEQMLLGECAVMAVATVLYRHTEEHTEGLKQFGRGVKVTDGGIQTIDEYRDAMKQIRDELVSSDPNLEACFGPFNP